MKLVDRQVTRELIGPFLFGVAAFTSVWFASSYLFKLTAVLTEAPMLTVVQLMVLPLPSIIVYTLPMATLLAVLIGLGRLSSDGEVVALFAGGISLYRVMVPVAFLGILVTSATIAVNELVAPPAYDRYQTLLAAVLKQTRPSDRPFTVRDSATNSQIIVNGGMDVSTGLLKNVTITQFVRNRPVLVVYADQAVWGGIKNQKLKYRWRLYGGWWQVVGTDSPAISHFSQSRTREIEIHKTPRQFALFQKSLDKKTEQMSFSELSRLLAYIKAYPDRPDQDIRKLDVDRWSKLALPMSSLVFAMLAAPLAVRPVRTGASVGFGLSILLIFLYWMVWHYTTSLAVQGSISPVVGAFCADFVGLVVALALLRTTAK